MKTWVKPFYICFQVHVILHQNIRFMRISSEMFPFASHATYGYSLDYCAPLLSQVGALASQLGHRLTTHPGQFTQLGSPRAEVVQSSLRELQYHAEMMDRMGLGVDGVMIVHVSAMCRLIALLSCPSGRWRIRGQSCHDREN